MFSNDEAACEGNIRVLCMSGWMWCGDDVATIVCVEEVDVRLVIRRLRDGWYAAEGGV